MRFEQNSLKLLLILTFLSYQLFANSRIETYFNNDESTFYTHPYANRDKRGHDFEKIIIQEVQKAESSVEVAVQEFRIPNLAKELVKLHESGVSVRIVLENKYNASLAQMLTIDWQRDNLLTDDQDDSDLRPTMVRNTDLFAFVDKNKNGEIEDREMQDRDAIHILRQAGIAIIDDKEDGSEGAGLMHHKFVVIDGKTLIATSANFTLSGIHGDYNKQASTGNANALMVIRDRPVSEYFLEEFEIMWGTHNKIGSSLFGGNKPFRAAKEFQVGSSKIKVKFSPNSLAMDYLESTNGLISNTLYGADSEVLMALFVFSEQRISNSLFSNRRRKRALKIDALVDRKFAMRDYSELLDMWGLELLDSETCFRDPYHRKWPNYRNVQAGVANLPSGDKLHHKFAVVDNSKVVFGSHNWSFTANYINDEFLMVIEDVKVAEKFKREYVRLRQNSRQGPSQQLLQRIEDTNQYCRI